MFYPAHGMRGLKQHAVAVSAVLTALALLVPVAPKVLALWGGGHDHGHGAGGWIHRSADHERHDASQLEPVEAVQRVECALCIGRLRSDVSLLLAPASAGHREAGRPIALATSHSVTARALTPSQPRAPPVV